MDPRSTLHKTLMWVIRLLTSTFACNNCGSSSGSLNAHCIEMYCGSLEPSYIFLQAITVGRHVDHLRKLNFLTSSIKMVAPIVSNDHVCVLHGPIMSNPVFLQGLGV